MMPLRKYYAIILIVFLSGQLTAQNDSNLLKNYAISDVYFVDYLGFIKPNLAVVPCNGGIFSPNWHSWYFKTQDTILSVEPSYLDTSLVFTRTSRNLFEIVKVPLNDVRKKPTPLVLTKGFIFYSVPSNFIRDLNFYVVGYNNKFNICRLYNQKVDTIFVCDSMIGQLEVVDKSTLLFCSGNKLMIYPLDEKPIVLFDADKYKIYGFSTDNKGTVYVSIDPGIIKIEKFSQLSILSTESMKGKLRYFDEKLYVLNAGNRTLSVIPVKSLSFAQLAAPAEKGQEKPPIAKSPGIMTNTDIISLVNAKTSDEQIINLINNSPVKFNTSVDSMIYLSGRNVSSAVILAMRNAMKTTGKRFYIITGSYPTEEKAREAVADLRLKGFGNAQVVGKSNAGTFRIASKGYDTIEEATKDLADVKQKLSPSAWIFESK